MSREKYQKSATQERDPRSLPWETIPLICAPLSPGRRKRLIAQTVSVCRKAAMSAERRHRGQRPVWLNFPASVYRAVQRGLSVEAEGGAPRGRRSAGHAGFRVLATHTRNQHILRIAKCVRCLGGGFLKGGTVGDSLKWRSLGTFLSPWTERCKHPPTPRHPQFAECPDRYPANSPMCLPCLQSHRNKPPFCLLCQRKNLENP